MWESSEVFYKIDIGYICWKVTFENSSNWIGYQSISAIPWTGLWGKLTVVDAVFKNTLHGYKNTVLLIIFSY